MDQVKFQKRYEMKAVGRLMQSGPSALASSSFSALVREMTEALSSLASDAARIASAKETLATVRGFEDKAAVDQWERLYAQRRVDVWRSAARIVRAVAVLVAAALGPDPVSYDEAGTGVDSEERVAVAVMAEFGRCEEASSDLLGFTVKGGGR